MKKPMDYSHDYEMAKMSGAAYATPEQIRLSTQEKDEDKRLLPDGWQIERYVEDKSSGFAAYAFINNDHKKIAISYRGSEPSYWGLDFRKPDIAIAHDGDTDLLRGLLGKRPREQVSGMMNKLLPDWDEQFTRGLEVAAVVLQRYGEAYKVYVTGHSLGGSIAHAITVDTQDSRRTIGFKSSRPKMSFFPDCVHQNYLHRPHFFLP